MYKNKSIQKRFQPKFHIKSGDSVIVIAGDDKGKTGVVARIITDENRAVVEGLNMVKRHNKPNAQSPQGGIVEKEAPIHISNLMLTVGGKPTRVGKKKQGDKMVRVAKISGEVIK